MSNRVKVRPAPRTAAPAPGTVTWRKAVPLLVLAFAIGALLGGPIGAMTAGGGDTFDDKVAELRAADAKRDAEQIVDLTAQVRRVQGILAPVLEGMAKAVPPGGPGAVGGGGAAGGSAAGPAATEADVKGWQAITAKVVEEFANPPSAGTAVNVARSGFSAAARSLDLAVSTYLAAIQAPAGSQAPFLAIAGKQRDAAVNTWSVAATQLDQINVDSGNGHQHVYLPVQPGQGGLTPDGEKEGK